jgi:hypothetical protein
LTSFFISRAKQPDLYNDGGNLDLQVESRTAMDFQIRRRYMSLGWASVVSLQEARAHQYRALRR